jgi:transposase
MSTSFLYHAFGVRGYEYRSTSYGKCRGRQVHANGRDTRVSLAADWREAGAVADAGCLKRRVPRVLCRSCFFDPQVKIRFADPKKSYTWSFARHVLELAGMMTLTDVAHNLQISRDVVKGIVGDDFQRRLAQPKLRSLQRIAIV